MKERIEAIRALVAEMRPELLEAGLKESTLELPQTIDTNDDWSVTNATDWLEDIRWDAFQEVLEIRKAHPPHVWKHFKDMGEKTLQEVRALKSKQRALKKAWMYQRPPVLFRPSAGKRTNGK